MSLNKQYYLFIFSSTLIEAYYIGRGLFTMRCLLLALVALVAACHAAVIPVHLPINVSVSDPAFTVPQYLGVFDVTVPQPSTWTLLPTYMTGGETFLGQFLVVRNRGPYCLTLETTPPESIESASSYVVKNGTAVVILSNSPDWVVVSLSDMSQEVNCIV